MSELKLCPFCDADLCSIYGDEGEAVWGACSNCGAETGNVETKEEAIETWNRVSDAVQRMKPKKVILKVENAIAGECPVCGGIVQYLMNRHFCDCGQKLDWREE